VAALRTEQPDLSWHTLGGHFSDSQAFWTAVGTGDPRQLRTAATLPTYPPRLIELALPASGTDGQVSAGVDSPADMIPAFPFIAVD
jgi:hypothetical protein